MAAPEKEGEGQKLRFGQWLLNAISSGSYRGLCWIDPARTIFRVPWKHNARKDITSSDLEVFKVGGMSVTSSDLEILRVGGMRLTSSSLRVFKAWAKVSGRYEEGYEDPAKWKTNFRCALSSTRMFKLEQDHSKHGDDPHKVFSIVSATLQHSKEGDSSVSNPVVDHQPAQQELQLELDLQDMASAIALPGSTGPAQLSVLEKLLQQCDISSRDVGSLAPSWVPTGDTPHQDTLLQPQQETMLQPHQDTLLQPHQEIMLQPHQEIMLQPHQDTLLQPHQDTLLQPYTDPSQNNCFPPTAFLQCVPMVEQPILDTYHPPGLMLPEETGAMPPPCHLTEGTVPMQYPAEATFFVPTPSPAPQPRLLVANTDGVSVLDVTIYYRGKVFHQEEVGSSHCLLTYQPHNVPEALCPWHVVRFPSPASLADAKQRRITEDLLGIAGLQLEQRAHKVFATRREKCKVFWALSQQLEGIEDPPPNLLCRGQETPIFDFHEFCTELRDFRNGQRRRSPDFTIYLCFGQAFSKTKPKESKLILVKLVPKFCEYCYEQVLQEGASSLDSRTISLQLSNSFDLMELIEQCAMQLG